MATRTVPNTWVSNHLFLELQLVSSKDQLLVRHPSLSVLQTSKQSLLRIYSSSLQTIRYIVIPAVNYSSRQVGHQNVAQWARDNNLKTNPAKFAEIVFVDNRKNNKAHPPPPLPGIVRVTTLKILGVTFTNSLSVAEHVHTVISSSAQTLYAIRLRVLLTNDIDDVLLQTIFRSVVIAS